MLEEITIPVPGGGSRPGVLALPRRGEGPFPGVVVIHDVTGFKPDTRRHCERFADEGYVAIAPDLYDGGRVRCVVRTLLDSKEGGRATMSILGAARRVLADRSDVDETRIAVTGFCMGGGFALLCAADHTYAVAAPFYGNVPKRKERLRGICPTLAQYGDRDTPFMSHAERLREHLEALGVEHEVIVHPGVGHAFMNDHKDWSFRFGKYIPLHAAYDAPTEAIAWRKLLDFFSAHTARTEP